MASGFPVVPDKTFPSDVTCTDDPSLLPQDTDPTPALPDLSQQVRLDN